MKVLKIQVPISVNNRDEKRCSHQCRYAEKINGVYHCTLFDENIDHGDDDEHDEYLFLRVSQCLSSETE